MTGQLITLLAQTGLGRPSTSAIMAFREATIIHIGAGRIREAES